MVNYNIIYYFLNMSQFQYVENPYDPNEHTLEPVEYEDDEE